MFLKFWNNFLKASASMSYSEWRSINIFIHPFIYYLYLTVPVLGHMELIPTERWDTLWTGFQSIMKAHRVESRFSFCGHLKWRWLPSSFVLVGLQMDIEVDSESSYSCTICTGESICGGWRRLSLIVDELSFFLKLCVGQHPTLQYGHSFELILPKFQCLFGMFLYLFKCDQWASSFSLQKHNFHYKLKVENSLGDTRQAYGQNALHAKLQLGNGSSNGRSVSFLQNVKVGTLVLPLYPDKFWRHYWWYASSALKSFRYVVQVSEPYETVNSSTALLTRIMPFAFPLALSKAAGTAKVVMNFIISDRFRLLKATKICSH